MIKNTQIPQDRQRTGPPVEAGRGGVDGRAIEEGREMEVSSEVKNPRV